MWKHILKHINTCHEIESIRTINRRTKNYIIILMCIGSFIYCYFHNGGIESLLISKLISFISSSVRGEHTTAVPAQEQVEQQKTTVLHISKVQLSYIITNLAKHQKTYDTL